MDKEKVLEATKEQVERRYGKGSLMRLGEHADGHDVLVIPTGSIGLDIALGIGGVPRGRVVEIYGPESSGKTTLALSIIAQCHRLGGIAAFIDAEHALDPSYAARLGVDVDNLLVSQPDTGEQALEITELLVRSGAIDVVVIDSVAALVPRAEIEGEMGDSHVGLQARLMSQALRKLSGAISKSMTCAIFINQLREKVGVMFGNPETTPGGRALKFYSSVRIDVRRIEAIKSGTEAIGGRVRAKIVKNKMAPPFRQAEFDIMYGEGISREGSILDLGVEDGVVMKSGAWYTYGEERVGQGRESAKQFLKEHADLTAAIEAEIKDRHGIEAQTGKSTPDVVDETAIISTTEAPAQAVTEVPPVPKVAAEKAASKTASASTRLSPSDAKRAARTAEPEQQAATVGP